MHFDTAGSYIVFGIAFLVCLIILVRADHLWKNRIRKQSIYAAGATLILGIALEFSDALNHKAGLVLVIMSAPAIYLSYFLIGRHFFIRLYHTEPYVTSSSSSVGGTPLDLYTPAGKDGKKRKFTSKRRIITADFAFTLAHTLGAAFTVIFLIYLVNKLNS